MIFIQPGKDLIIQCPVFEKIEIDANEDEQLFKIYYINNRLLLNISLNTDICSNYLAMLRKWAGYW